MKRPREEDDSSTGESVVVRHVEAPLPDYRIMRRIPLHWSVALSPVKRDLLYRVAWYRGGHVEYGNAGTSSLTLVLPVSSHAAD